MPTDTPCPSIVMIDLEGTKIAARQFGKGPPVLCLHAIGHGARDFDQVAERLGTSYRFIAIDWPGHGDSPAEAKAPTARHYATIVRNLLAALDLKDVVILGNSIGGAAAILRAAAEPERIRGLVLCSPGGLIRSIFLVRAYCRWYARFFARGAAGNKSFPAAFRLYYERKILPAPAAKWRREEIIASAQDVAPLLSHAWAGFAARDADVLKVAAEVRCPVLYAWAKGDQVNNWRFSKRGAMRVPDHRVELLPGGHAPFLEAPDAFDASFVRFERSLPRPKPLLSSARA